MTDVNSVNVNSVAAINSNSSDAMSGLAATLAGSVVEDLDAQIEVYSQELMDISAEKSQIMDAKTGISSLDVYENIDADRASSEFKLTPEADAIELVDSEYQKLYHYAESLGALDMLNNKSLLNTDNPNKVVSQKLIDELKDLADKKIQNLNSSSEMKMIQFQSLMDSRKQAMMMLSNLVNSDGQTKMAILQNMKS